jgi:hypothetical protein
MREIHEIFEIVIPVAWNNDIIRAQMELSGYDL